MKSFPWHLNWSLENRLCVREADVISDEVFAVARWRLMLYWKETSKRNRNITGSKTCHSWNEGCLQHDGCGDLSSQMFKINASICLYWLSLVFTDRNCVYYLHLWVEESRFGAINSNNGHHKPSWKRKKKQPSSTLQRTKCIPFHMAVLQQEIMKENSAEMCSAVLNGILIV